MIPPARSVFAPLNCGGLCLVFAMVAIHPRIVAAEGSDQPTRPVTAPSAEIDEQASDALTEARRWMDALVEGGIREVAGDAWPAELAFEATDSGSSAETQQTGAGAVSKGNAAGFSSSSASVASNELALRTAANSGNRILRTVEEQFPLMVFGVICAAGICAVSWLTKP